MSTLRGIPFLFYFLATAVMTFSSVHADNKDNDPPVLHLSELLEEARQANPEILAAKKLWEVEAAKIGSVSNWTDPEIGIELMGSTETRYTVEQMIPFPGKLALRGAAQHHEALRWHGAYLAKEREIEQTVKSIYYDYFRVTRDKNIVKENTLLLEQLARTAQKHYAAGLSTQSEVLRAQAELARASNQLVILTRDEQIKQIQLNALINRPPDSALGYPSTLPARPLSLNPKELEILALENRAEVQIARHHAAHMNAELAAVRADYLPDAAWQYGRRIFNNGMDPENIWMVKWNLPFVWGQRQQSTVKSVEEMGRHAEAELNGIETMTRQNVKTLSIHVETAWRLLDLYQHALIPQAKQSLDVALSGYSARKLSILDVIDTERTWLEFHRDYYQALTDYWTRISELEQVVGKDLALLDKKEDKQ